MGRHSYLYNETIKLVPEQKGKPLIAAGVALAIRRGLDTTQFKRGQLWPAEMVNTAPLSTTNKPATDEELLDALKNLES